MVINNFKMENGKKKEGIFSYTLPYFTRVNKFYKYELQFQIFQLSPKFNIKIY